MSAVYSVIKMLFFTVDPIGKIAIMDKLMAQYQITSKTESEAKSVQISTKDLAPVSATYKTISDKQRTEYERLMSNHEYKRRAQQNFINDYLNQTSGQQFQNTLRRLLYTPFDRNINLALNIKTVESCKTNTQKCVDAEIDMQSGWNGLVYSAKVLPRGNLSDYKSFGSVAANGLYSFAEAFIVGGLTFGIGIPVMLGIDIYTKPKINQIINYVIDTGDINLSEYSNFR